MIEFLLFSMVLGIVGCAWLAWHGIHEPDHCPRTARQVMPECLCPCRRCGRSCEHSGPPE